jgi:histidinol-phosphate aminotransferase
VEAQLLRDFCREASKKTVVLVDEAYQEYIDPEGKDSMMHLTFTHPNLLVIKTFSKIHGMAGMRLGFITGHPSIIGKLEQNYFSNTQSCVSNLTLAAALASLKDRKHTEQSRLQNEAARSYAFDEIRKMGFTCYPSHTNFLFFHLGNFKGNFSQEMLSRNFIVRSSQYGDGQWCRASVGTLDEMRSFCRELKSVNS